MKNRLNSLLLLSLLILVAFAAVACGGTNPQGAATPQPTARPVKSSDKVVAQGKVVPVRTSTLSVPAAGIVSEVLIAEGDKVTQGKPLVRLTNKQQLAAIASAEAGLKRAQARVDELKAGPRQPEIAAAEAAVASAQAGLAAAKAARAKLDAGADQNAIIAAKADVDNAYAAVKQAQAAYDRAGGASNPYAGMLPTSLQLEQATNTYNAAKARYDALFTGPRAADIQAADAEIQRAETEIQRAQAQLDLVKAGTRPETIAAAQQDVAVAQTELDRAKTSLTDTELTAPFAGTIASLDIHVGEQVSPGTSAVKLADLSAWQIETTDLTELNIGRVREGDAVTLTFDAIGDFSLPGKVSRVRSIGENRQGDIVYTVVVKPDTMDERLRWNMTAQVTITPSGK